jgi:hypothetical protein
VHKFQLSVLIVLRVDPANVGVGCANVLMANGFTNGCDARANWMQQSVELAVSFGSRSGGDTVRHCAFTYFAFPSGRIRFKCHRLP